MRLRWKFLALLLPAGIAAAGLILLLIQRSVHSVILGELERSVAVGAKTAAQNAAPGFQARDEAMLLPLLQSLQSRYGALYAAALDPDGKVLAHTQITEKGRVYRDAVALEAQKGDAPAFGMSEFRGQPALEAAVPVRLPAGAQVEEAFLLSGDAHAESSPRLGVLKLAVPLGPAQETESRILRNCSLIVALIGGLSLACVLLLIRGILEPVNVLMAGIAGIGQGRTGVTVPVLTRDELGDLAVSFNDMSAELARTTVSKEYVEGILENMADLLIVTDPDCRIMTLNHAVEETLGRPSSELAGKPLASLFLEGSALAAGELKTLLSAGPVRDLETAFKTRSGRAIPALTSASVLRRGDGSPRGYVCVAKDITDRKQAEESILAAKAAAEAANRELEAFSSSVAHDLRAPLRTIDGFTGVVLDDCGGRLGPEGIGYLERVRAGARRMGQLIDDLLNMSRITRAEMRIGPVDLSAMARDIIAELRRAQPERKVEFIAADGLRVEGDASLLRVALVNLLGNAWKYTGKRDAARIEFGCDASDGARAFFVRDDGAGFDMAYESKLFREFTRLHAASEFEGTGIGLTTVKRVVERHGGRVWARGEPGKGATFTFTLRERYHA